MHGEIVEALCTRLWEAMEHTVVESLLQYHEMEIIGTSIVNMRIAERMTLSATIIKDTP